MPSYLTSDQVFIHTGRTKTHRAESKDNPPHQMSAGIVHPEFQPKKLHLDVNHLPKKFRDAGAHGYMHVGRTSLTLHAEAANYRDFAKPLEGSAQFMPVDPCTNCVKDGIAAGISAVFIDIGSKTSHYRLNHARKSAGKTEGFQFDKLGLPLYSIYGVAVYEVDRKNSEIKLLNEKELAPARDYPIFEFFPEAHHVEGLKHYMSKLAKAAPDLDWTLAPVTTQQGQQGYLAAYETSPNEINPNLALSKSDMTSGKFTQTIDSLCNAVMTAKRLGMTITDGQVGGNFLPYPRQLVNAIAYGVTDYQYMHPTAPDRLADRVEAAAFMNQKRIANIRSVTGAPLAYA